PKVSTGNNKANPPPQTRMQTRNGARLTVQDTSVGAQNALANNARVPEASCSSTSP
ncbi:hypothetical protein HAX54_028003, partial [Datura stramonium]|nr:hypothetical protein [Datura stramonium]